MVRLWFASVCTASVLALVLPACLGGDCSCDWEGGQSILVQSVSRDGDVLYVAASREGQPCCEDTWTVSGVVYRIDLTGYLEGAVTASVVDQAVGDEAPLADGVLALDDLGIQLKLSPDAEFFDWSVMMETVPLFAILDPAGNTELGEVLVPAGESPGAN